MARDFSGTSGNRLSIGDAAEIDITGTALTLAAWIRPDTVTGFHRVLAKNDNANSARQYLLQTNGTNVQMFAGSEVAAAAGLSSGSWQHIAGVKNGTGGSGLTAYLNGAGTSASSPGSIANTAQSLAIGESSDGGTSFDGLIAEVAIWNVALTADEITALAKGFAPPLVRPQSLAGYWPLIGNANPEPDLRNGNNGTVTGTVDKADHPRIIMPRPALYIP